MRSVEISTCMMRACNEVSTALISATTPRLGILRSRVSRSARTSLPFALSRQCHRHRTQARDLSGWDNHFTNKLCRLPPSRVPGTASGADGTMVRSRSIGRKLLALNRILGWPTLTAWFTQTLQVSAGSLRVSRSSHSTMLLCWLPNSNRCRHTTNTSSRRKIGQVTGLILSGGWKRL
jgi:hypothetical protein